MNAFPQATAVFLASAATLGMSLFGTAGDACADPRLTSWFTEPSGLYARLYGSTTDESTDNAVATWTRGQGTQSFPTYAGVSEVSHSDDWVYIRSTGLGFHVMGPWYLDAAKTVNFPNFPANTATLYRIPRVPTIPAVKSLTNPGAIGYFVDGVAMFDNRDTFSYSNANGIDASPPAGIGLGDGVWNRDAYVNEGVTFDAAAAHQAGAQYHYHANPPALRSLLDDHVDYDEAANRYSESTSSPPAHSPILGWVGDGFPLYGPYGYASSLDPESGVRRMLSGYQKRDGTNGTVNLAATGRATLPSWAALANNRSTALTPTQYGPAVNATYTLGHYLEDYAYLGNLGLSQGTHFDLDQYNGRFCVTPEFPEGTYAYFVSIEADGTPVYPYNIGRQFYGTPTAGAVPAIAEEATIVFSGGPNKSPAMNSIAVDKASGDIVLTWDAVEGGTYVVSSSEDFNAWTAMEPAVTAESDSAQSVESGGALDLMECYYRVALDSLSDFDAAGFNYSGPGAVEGDANYVWPVSGARGVTMGILIHLTSDVVPPLPPVNAPILAIGIGEVVATAVTRVDANSVYALFTIPAGSLPGVRDVNVFFSGPTYNVPGAFTFE